jgi:hypothetical protein
VDITGTSNLVLELLQYYYYGLPHGLIIFLDSGILLAQYRKSFGKAIV